MEKTYETWLRYGDGQGGLSQSDYALDEMSGRRAASPKAAARSVLSTHGLTSGTVVAVREAGRECAPLHVFRVTRREKLKRVA